MKNRKAPERYVSRVFASGVSADIGIVEIDPDR